MNKINIKTPANMVVIYHGNCTDGFGAACAVYSVYRDKPVYLRGYYQKDPPMSKLVGKDVFLVDFSYKRDQLTTLSRIARTVTVIDHHVSAEKELAGGIADNVEVNFNMKKSGAVLTWEYFHDLDTHPVPDLLRHIQDRDLWKFKLPKTREITTALHSERFDFKTWMNYINKGCDTLAMIGGYLCVDLDKRLDAAMANAYLCDMCGRGNIPIVNARPELSSELGNRLSVGHSFAVTYWDTGDLERVYSLRSQDDGLDVSVICAAQGGGGHRNAAGFSSPIEVTHIRNPRKLDR